MLNPKMIEDIAGQLLQALPPSLQNLEKEFHEKFRAILSSTFNKLDLVTREEFDTQLKVLARTREKVDALEKLLEAQMKDSDKK